MEELGPTSETVKLTNRKKKTRVYEPVGLDITKTNLH